MSRIGSMEELAAFLGRGGARVKGNPLDPKGAAKGTVPSVGSDPKSQKRAKYGNEKTLLDGIVFDSKKEAARWEALSLLQRVGEIRELERQVEFELLLTPIKMSYVSDFCYQERRQRAKGAYYWHFICEDTKGFKTREYRRKRKAMKTVFGIVIRET